MVRVKKYFFNSIGFTNQLIGEEGKCIVYIGLWNLLNALGEVISANNANRFDYCGKQLTEAVTTSHGHFDVSGCPGVALRRTFHESEFQEKVGHKCLYTTPERLEYPCG